jgi:hypothetical protein
MSTPKPPWYKAEATGSGRCDWAVHGLNHVCADECGYASDPDNFIDRCGLPYCQCECDLSCNVPVSGGLFEHEAEQVCGMNSMREVAEFLLGLGDRFYRDPIFGISENLDSEARPGGPIPRI